MAIKKEELSRLLKRVSNSCGIQDLQADHNIVYGYQLVINGNERPAGLKSFKDRAFEGYLNGFADGCRYQRNR